MGTCFRLFGATTTMMKLHLMVSGLLMAALVFETTVGWGIKCEDFDVKMNIGMAEAYCGTDKADYSEQDKNCFNRELEMTVRRAEYFLEEMREINSDMAYIGYHIPMLIEMM